MAGGGGGGSDGTTYFSTGASAGSLVAYPLNLTPGQSIPITIGNGGGPNQDGGSTSFGAYFYCSGGKAKSGGNADPGNCGTVGSSGLWGQFLGIGSPAGDINYGGGLIGPATAIGYGSGGSTFKCWGCAAPNLTYASGGISGVVIVDVLY